ncbi:MAG: hypothetical protein ACE5HZ_08040, partial [Fidelibacterota bacterium]
ILTSLGLFLILFAVIIFGSRLLLGGRTRAELKRIQEPAPSPFQSQNRLLSRPIIVFVLILLGLFILLFPT